MSVKVPRTTHQWLKPLYDFLDGALTTISAGQPEFEVNLVDTSALAACTYANGTAGVGATLTGNANGAMASIDSVAPVLNYVYLITAQSSTFQNGIYTLTQLGDGSNPFILTRLGAYNQSAEIKQGTVIGVRSGTVHANTQWEQTSADSPVVGTDAMTFVRSSGNVTTNTAQTISAIKTFSAAPVFAAGLTASGAVANDFSGATGTFKTSSGANTLSGDTTVAANKSLSAASGSGAVDLSPMTGTFKTPSGLHTFGGKIAFGASVQVLTDPGNAGAIAVTSDGVCNLTSAGAETRTLAAPTFVGQRIILAMDTDGGDIVVTVSAAFNQASNTTITLNDAGDHVELVCATIGGTRRWRIVNNDGCTLG